MHKQIDGVGLMGLLCEENEKERDIDSKVASEYFSLSCLALLLHAFVIFHVSKIFDHYARTGFVGTNQHKTSIKLANRNSFRKLAKHLAISDLGIR